jgi:hypothetical protein
MATTGPQRSGQHAGEQRTGHSSQSEPSRAENIASTVTGKVQDMASGAKETVEEWGSAAAEAASQAGQKAQDLARSAAHTAENFGEELTAFIRRYPMPSLLVGLSIGFLLAQLGRRS